MLVFSRIKIKGKSKKKQKSREKVKRRKGKKVAQYKMKRKYQTIEAEQKALGAKKIVIDEVAANFLKNMKSIRLKSNYQAEAVAILVGHNPKAIREYERYNRTPTLRTFIKLAELFNYDVSESINYKFYHRKINTGNLIKRIRYYGLTIADLSAITGYSTSAISKSIHLKRGASILCLYTVMQAIEDEEKRYAAWEHVDGRITKIR